MEVDWKDKGFKLPSQEDVSPPGIASKGRRTGLLLDLFSRDGNSCGFQMKLEPVVREREKVEPWLARVWHKARHSFAKEESPADASSIAYILDEYLNKTSGAATDTCCQSSCYSNIIEPCNWPSLEIEGLLVDLKDAFWSYNEI